MALEFIRKIRALFAPPRHPPPQNTRDVAAAVAPADSPAFQLHGCRELLREYRDNLPISSTIEIIERSIPADPGFAFTHCRGLLETVCKTILTDRGVATPSDANSNQIMSAALKVLKLTAVDFDNDVRVEAGVVDLVRGINQVVNGVVALRNSQGLGPHGRDALEAVLDAEYAAITARAIDSVACLLYRMHRKHAERDPLSRIRFGDYPEFDASVDEKYSNIKIEETPIQASKALCLLEPEAYRQALMQFLASPEPRAWQEEFAAGEELKEDANG